jgi:hypothetical protein
MQHLASGQQARRSAVRVGRVAFVAAAAFLLGLIAIFVHDAKATPQSAIGFSQITGATCAAAPDDDQEATCPVCGRLGCPTLLAASPPDTALSPTDLGPVPVIGFVRLSRARVPGMPLSIFPTSFEPRGPPFVE